MTAALSAAAAGIDSWEICMSGLGLPRTKRTAKPQAALYDALSRVRQLSLPVERDGNLVKFTWENRTFYMSAESYDRICSEHNDVNISIKVPDSGSWADPDLYKY